VPTLEEALAAILENDPMADDYLSQRVAWLMKANPEHEDWTIEEIARELRKDRDSQSPTGVVPPVVD
jgi:hypothetical protein